MTPAERMTAERSRIEKSGNIYVTPFRMAKLMDAASKNQETVKNPAVAKMCLIDR